MRIINHFWNFLVGMLRDETGTLTFTVVKRFKPQAGIRRGIIDITIDALGPTWSITAANLGLQGTILNLQLTGQVDGWVFGVIPVSGNATITMEARKEADSTGALQQITAADAENSVVRAEYTGY